MRWRRARPAAWPVLLLLLLIAPVGADEPGAPPALPSADQIDSMIDAGYVPLDDFEDDVPPESPKGPPPPPPRPTRVPVIETPPSVRDELDPGTVAEIDEVGEYLQQQLQQTTDDAEGAYLEGVRQRAIKAPDRTPERAGAASSGAPPPKDDHARGAATTATRSGLRFGNRPTHRYAEDVAGPESTSGAMDTTPDHGEAAAAFGRAAFGERSREDAGVVVTPQDQGWFDGGRSLHAPSPAHEGRSDPSQPPPERRRRRGMTEPPPPPTSGRGPSSSRRDGGSMSLLTEKGVRIQFDPAALASARLSDDALAAMEDRLLGARSPGDVATALREADHVLARQHFGGLEETTFRGVTIVSLARLVEEASAWRERWDALPDHLRHPGGLRRLVGFFRAPDGGDLFLLGTTEGTYPRVDLDDLIVGLGATWRDGVVPICSLDPDPQDPSGPQRTVVVGIPKHTHFADVMLRADYEMKRVQFGHRPSEVPGFVNLADAMRRVALERLDTVQVNARAWFMPIQPQPGEIRLSPDGNLALFRAGMQLLTESMARRNGQLVGTGRRDPLMEETTDFLTRHLDAFEREIPEFGQLHALFDIVLLGNVLEREGVRADVLDRLLELPVRHVPIPDSYPGVTQIIRLGPLVIGTLTGGVRIDPKLQTGSVVRTDDPRMRALGRLCANAGGLRTELPEAEVPLFRARGAALRRKENAYVQASRHGSRLEAIVATRVIGRLIREAPGDVALYALRAQAYAAARLHALADRDLLVAERRSRGASAFRLARLQVALDREPRWDPGRVDPTDREPLASLYATAAMQRLGARVEQDAARQIERALALAPEQVEYMALRVAITLASGDTADAARLLTGYLEEHPTSAVLQLTWARLCVAAKDYDAGIEAATRVLAHDPDHVDARILRAMATLQRDALDTEAAYRDLRAALKIQPHSGRLQVLKAQLLAAEGDMDGAKVAARRAIELAPGLAVAHATWAKLLAGYEFTSSGVIHSHPRERERLELLGAVNTALLLQAPPFAMRLIRLELLMMYAEGFDPNDSRPPSWFKDREVSARLTVAMMESPASMQNMVALGALGQPKDRAGLRHVLALFRQAIVHAVLADLQAAARAAPAGPIRKAFEGKALELQQQLQDRRPR